MEVKLNGAGLRISSSGARVSAMSEWRAPPAIRRISASMRKKEAYYAGFQGSEDGPPGLTESFPSPA